MAVYQHMFCFEKVSKEWLALTVKAEVFIVDTKQF